MTANQIVMKHYNTLIKICSNICDNHDLVGDFTSEMLLLVLEYDILKLQELDESNQLKFWFSRICKNQWSSKTSSFYYKYKKRIPDDYIYEIDGYSQFKPRERYEE